MRKNGFYFGGHATFWSGLLAVAFGLVSISGCGGTDRAAIEGAVTLDGKPLESGRVTFRPQRGTESPSAGGKIVDGYYSVDSEGGVLPGKFRVEITAKRPTGKKVPNRFTGEMVMLEEQYLPERYNRNSQLELTVPPEGGTITQDFELTR